MFRLRKHASPLRQRTASTSPIPTFFAFPLLLWLLLSAATPVVAQTSLEDLPTCGLACLGQGLEVSGCGLMNVTCQCGSTAQTGAVSKCLLANCTMQDSLGAFPSSTEQCDFPHESRSAAIIISMSVLWAGGMMAVALRVVSKCSTQTFCGEDYAIISVILLSTVPMGCVLSMAKLGLGTHLWDLRDGALKQILLLFYISEVIYVAAMALTKASIVAMYMRIFQAYRPFRIACYAALGFIILPSLAILLATIFSCRPVAFFWDRDLRVTSSSSSPPSPACLNIQALAYANSAFALAQDTLIIVLPVFMLWSLNMSRRRKLLLALMFGVGSLGLVATMVRLRTLRVFGTGADPTWDYVPVVYLTVAELAAGVTCSCLPALRILAERMWWVWSGKPGGWKAESGFGSGTVSAGKTGVGSQESASKGSRGVRMKNLARATERSGQDEQVGGVGSVGGGRSSRARTEERIRSGDQQECWSGYDEDEEASIRRLAMTKVNTTVSVNADVQTEEEVSPRSSESGPRTKHDFELG
ncbi:hypothetical protein BD289DRAFT_361467 [Coniella lustricola]|uniref:CFEM domain-containing protein n=1 Tax=Coniella lustricola TaxID=2025994 RepID=A0A2T3AIC9_9PEZI|nr:hypothetical protein BD289DRAFT_361467 [Coniella lustricola]